MATPADQQKDDVTPKKGRRRRRAAKGVLWLVVLVGILLSGTTFLLKTRGLTTPDWLTRQVETRFDEILGDKSLSLSTIELAIADNWEPQLELRDVVLANAFGAPIARFDKVETAISPEPLLSGSVQPKAVRLSGGDLRLRRSVDGSFNVELGSENTLSASGSLQDVLANIEDFFGSSALVSLNTLEATNVSVRYEDAALRRVFRASGAYVRLRKDDQRISLDVDTAILGAEADRARITLTANRPADGLMISAAVSEVRPSELQLGRDGFGWLDDLRVPVSMQTRASLSGDGRLLELSGSVRSGAGEVVLGLDEPPMQVTGADVRFHVEPETNTIVLDSINAETDLVSFSASGQAFPEGGELVAGERLVSQLTVSSVVIPAEGVMSEPIELTAGQVDARISFAPFGVEFGQIALAQGDDRIFASGKVWASEEGWGAELDAFSDQVSRDAFIAFWPVSAKVKMRSWLNDNILAADLQDAAIGLRWQSGQPIRFGTNFSFENATIRYLKTLPAITAADGIGVFQDNAFSLTVSKGRVTPPTGGPIQIIAGSSFRVPDVREKPAQAIVSLKTESGAEAALSLLSQKPFGFLQKAGIKPKSASGQARLATRLQVPLQKNAPLDTILFSVSGTARNLASDTLVKGRQLRVPTARVEVTNDNLLFSGQGTLDGVPFDGAFEQALTDNPNGLATFEGQVEVSQAATDTLNLGLPAGTISGTGSGRLRIEIARDQPERFAFSSDLNRMGLAIPALGWRKPAAQTGRFEISGALGTPPVIDGISLKAAGLDAEGRLALSADGGLETLNLSRIVVGRWLNASAILRGRGKGRPPAVEVTGGLIDVRETTFGSGGGSSGSGGPPIALALDRLQVSNGIWIGPFRGEISSAGGLSGQFTGRVGGTAPIQGTLVPSQQGTAIRIRSNEAGAVLSASGVLKNVRGGVLDLVLSPRSEPGAYNGRLEVANTRLIRASAMAELLNAISVVGLLDQLNGPGIQFSTVEASFVLTPRRVVLTRSAAVGPSMGISLDGIYDLASRAMDMQGVVSPIYAINGIGQIFTRRGEGLFGFNFRIRGDAEDPQVTVNPLSIFTPGMFREIFRRPPPSPSQ